MRLVIAAFLVLFATGVMAQDLYMVRSPLSFPEAMSALQEAIKEQGYRVSRVQRVDIGLTASGYKTDKYRVVFFGKSEDLDVIDAGSAGMLAYYPLKIAIYAEGEDTILLAAGFRHLKNVYADEKLSGHLERWEKDIAAILETARIAE